MFCDQPGDFETMQRQSPTSTPDSVVTNSRSSCGFRCRGKTKKVVDRRERGYVFCPHRSITHNHLVKFEKTRHCESKCQNVFFLFLMDRSTPSLKLINSCWRRILVIGSAGPETTESGGGGGCSTPQHFYQVGEPDGLKCNCFNGEKKGRGEVQGID